MTTLSDKIRAFMLENEKELKDTETVGYFTDCLAELEWHDRVYEPDAREIANTIAEARYESREM